MSKGKSKGGMSESYSNFRGSDRKGLKGKGGKSDGKGDRKGGKGKGKSRGDGDKAPSEGALDMELDKYMNGDKGEKGDKGKGALDMELDKYMKGDQGKVDNKKS